MGHKNRRGGWITRRVSPPPLRLRTVLSRLKCGGDRGADYTQISPLRQDFGVSSVERSGQVSNSEIHASLGMKKK